MVRELLKVFKNQNEKFLADAGIRAVAALFRLRSAGIRAVAAASGAGFSNGWQRTVAVKSLVELRENVLGLGAIAATCVAAGGGENNQSCEKCGHKFFCQR